MKKVLFLAAAAAVTLSSCLKDDVTEVLTPSDNIDAIGFDFATSVTRGVETTADLIRGNSDVTLYYSSSTTGTGWINYAYASDAWSQAKYQVGSESEVTVTSGDELYWSAIGFSTSDDTSSDPTVAFYSISDGTTCQTLSSVTATTAVGEEFTPIAGFVYPATPTELISNQADLVSYAGTVSSIPGGGDVRATFNHTLSRVEFYSNQGAYLPYVKSVVLCNVYPSATPTIGSANNTVTWTLTDGVEPKTSYLYFSCLDSDLSQTGATENYGQLMSDQGIIGTYTSGLLVSSDDMMIIPQTLTSGVDTFENILANKESIDYSNADAATVTSALVGIPYVGVIYRMTDENQVSVVGYQYAIDCDSYKETVASDGGVTPTYVTDASHLYVFVGFPFDGNELAASYDYDIYLGFGSTGGILLSDYYYTSDGVETNIPIEGLEPGDQVIPSSDTPIGLTITVNSWNTASNISID